MEMVGEAMANWACVTCDSQHILTRWLPWRPFSCKWDTPDLHKGIGRRAEVLINDIDVLDIWPVVFVTMDKGDVVGAKQETFLPVGQKKEVDHGMQAMQ